MASKVQQLVTGDQSFAVSIRHQWWQEVFKKHPDHCGTKSEGNVQFLMVPDCAWPVALTALTEVAGSWCLTVVEVDAVPAGTVRHAQAPTQAGAGR